MTLMVHIQVSCIKIVPMHKSLFTVIQKSLLIFLVVSSMATNAFAIEYRVVKEGQHYDPSLWRQEEVYIDRAFGKLIYGAWNFFLGPFELVREPYEAYAVGDSLLVGLGRGILFAAGDTIGGLLNAFTFPFTTLVIPLPEGGVDAREF